MEIIGKLRSEIPDIALRTTLITGFPGESEANHEELMEFVDEIGVRQTGSIYIFTGRGHTGS